MRATAAVIATAALLAAGSVNGGELVRWAIDPQQSRAQFRVRLLAILPIAGSFDSVQGSIAFDDDTAQAQVEAELDSAALRMRNASHAAWARSEEFFDAARHPSIRFRSDRFRQALLREGGEIAGDLTLRGVTRAVTFRVAPSDCATETARQCRVEVSGQVRRSDFGMAARAGTVSDWVSLRLQVVAAAH